MALTEQSATRKDIRNARAATFEHRHFSTVAAIIRDMDLSGYDAKAASVRHDIAQQFATELAHTNPRFDRARFLRACGLKD